MAWYKYDKILKKSTSAEYDKLHNPGEIVPHSGIYRCEACGFEAVSTKGNRFPPARNCREHSTEWKCEPGEIEWRLIVYPQHTNV